MGEITTLSINNSISIKGYMATFMRVPFYCFAMSLCRAKRHYLECHYRERRGTLATVFQFLPSPFFHQETDGPGDVRALPSLPGANAIFFID